MVMRQRVFKGDGKNVSLNGVLITLPLVAK